MKTDQTKLAEHPCKGLSKAHREAFERIAVNQAPGCTRPTIDALLKAGVIEHGPKETRQDALGVYQIPSFVVPLLVHMQWCEWCSENVGDGL